MPAFTPDDLAAVTQLQADYAAAADSAQAEIGEHLGDAYWAAGRRVDARYAWAAALLHADPVEAARLRAKLDSGLTTASAAP